MSFLISAAEDGSCFWRLQLASLDEARACLCAPSVMKQMHWNCDETLTNLFTAKRAPSSQQNVAHIAMLHCALSLQSWGEPNRAQAMVRFPFHFPSIFQNSFLSGSESGPSTPCDPKTEQPQMGPWRQSQIGPALIDRLPLSLDSARIGRGRHPNLESEWSANGVLWLAPWMSF